MLHIRHLIKRYGGQTILNVESLSLDTGVHWFKGKNGSGKTTLFKSLSGITPCAGAVAIDDVSLHRNPVEYRKLINFSEAEPVYPGFLTPAELLHFVAAAKHSEDSQRERLIQQFSIGDYQRKAFSACSSGMVKKVALAQAFLGKPRVIVLDEPMITLDKHSASILMTLIKEYITSFGTIFLISNHQEMEEDILPVKGIYLVENGSITPL